MAISWLATQRLTADDPLRCRVADRDRRLEFRFGLLPGYRRWCRALSSAVNELTLRLNAEAAAGEAPTFRLSRNRNWRYLVC